MLPGVAAPTLAVLVMPKSAVAATVSVALTELGLAPTEVDKEPAGIVLMTWGETMDVTTTETEQLAPGGIRVPVGSVKLSPPAVATGTAGVQEVATNEGLALTNPD